MFLFFHMVTFIFLSILECLKNHNKDVALATIVSSEAKFKLDGPEINNEFWVVHVVMALVETKIFVQSRKNCNTLGNAEKQRFYGLQTLYVTNILPSLLLASCQCIVC